MAIETGVQIFEALCLFIILGNIIFTYHQLGRNGSTVNNWGNALAQTIVLAWAIVGWVALDDGTLFTRDARLKAFQSVGVLNIAGFGLQLAMTLKWLPVTRQSLHYRPIYNKLLIALTILVGLICLVLVLLAAALVGTPTQIEMYARFGMTVWGGYSSLLAIAIAATVGAMVVRTKRKVLQTTSFDKDQTDMATWLGRLGYVLYAGSGVVAAVVLLVCVLFALARGNGASNRIAAAIVKLGGCIVMSWLLFIIFTIRHVTAINQRFPSAAGTARSSGGYGNNRAPSSPLSTKPFGRQSLTWSRSVDLEASDRGPRGFVIR
ncbi:hypothetical protein HK104_004559 [Borealophlyctis nickersoniae]|nr:hypothetical protein HK104_004559 [Borealophlyctis nickersoniae]